MVRIALRLVGIGLLAAALAGGSLAVEPREADRADGLARIETYLNGLRSLRAEFEQFASNGGRATGDLYYKRPDKMRLDYDPPSELLIIANDWQLIYHDRRLEQTSHLFTSSTPLGFLLKQRIRLGGDVTVTDFARVDGELWVTIVQSDEPEEGELTLVFSQSPLALKRWTVTDPQGLTTHVVLRDVRTNVPLDDQLFRFRNPRLSPGGRDD